MITIKDVAKRAGVSITSASYAINGNGTIGQATRARVLQAAEELNYHPNAFARNLKKPKTRTIGVFISRFGGSFYEDILEGIHETILTTDYELIVCPESANLRKYLTYRQVDGAIVFDSKVESSLFLKLVSKNFPIVVMDRYLEADYLLPLLVDNAHGVREVFYHLYNQGARRIGYISGAQDAFDNQERTNAFLLEADKNGIEVATYQGSFTERSGYQAAQLILERLPLPEAVFCANDQMAIGLLQAMQEHRLAAPDDIAVVGFDNIHVAQFLRPTLSSVDTFRFSWGEAAARQLIDYLEHGTSFQYTRMPTSLIVRASSSRGD